MTMEAVSKSKRYFSVRILPWLVATGALFVYLLTINPWVSSFNLADVARVSGWDWQPELTKPAYYVATLPLRLLPAKWVPFGLNLFSALCAVLTLAQLARSVALLPHDRTHEEREREKSDDSLLTIPTAWLPPLVAAVVCGLQMTFWEHATNGTGEMLDLLLFAWVIRALLEFRLDGRDSWLFRAAVVYGVGMTNNYAMWGFLPLFITALIWLRGMSFFNLRFLGRMALFGLAGLSLYLLLPLMSTFSDISPVSFWQALKTNIGAQKYVILAFPKVPTRGLENVEWVILLVVCVLPTLLFSIRWPSYFGDTSQLGIRMATIIFHFMFGLYLCVCLWCLLDAPFSPRYHGYGFVPFLTFYYLAALSVGYISGYFLLVFRNRIVRGRMPPAWTRLLNRTVLGLVTLIILIAPAGLIARNLPQIRTTNGPILKNFAIALIEGLPEKGAVLSDDPRRLLLAQAWLAHTGRLNNFLMVDTRSLPWPAYHRLLNKQHPDKWKAPPPPSPRELAFDPLSLVQLITDLAKNTELWYLHPSFGYYFEYFFIEPHKLAYQLKRYDQGSLLPPSLPEGVFSENESFWNRMTDETLGPILAVTQPREPGTKGSFVERCLKAAYVPREANSQTLAVGTYYSHALNYWGVETQKRGELEKAGKHFGVAERLNPKNVVAQINREYNEKLQAGEHKALELPKSIEDRFGQYRSWDQVLGENGPYDEPGFCYAQGDLYLRTRHFHQAAQAFQRVSDLLPTDLPSRLWLARLHLAARLPARTLELIQDLRQHSEKFSLNRTNHAELLGIEARAYFLQDESGRAEQVLESAINRSPEDEQLLAIATGVYFETGSYSNALTSLDRMLKLAPNNAFAFLNKGIIHMQVGAFDEAISAFTRASILQTNDYTALLYRAACQIRADHLEAAQGDYETLQRALPSMYQVYFGLGEVAYRRKDTNAAIGHYENYLAYAVPTPSNAPPHPEEIKLVSNRLAELKGGKP